MTPEKFKILLRERAPYLDARVWSMQTFEAICDICRQVGLSAPASSNGLHTTLDLIWDHIEEIDWREKEPEPMPLCRDLSLTVLASQIATYAARKRLLTAVFTRQVECLAENRLQEAVSQVEQDQRESLGWSSW